jgi:hypothetical protein
MLIVYLFYLSLLCVTKFGVFDADAGFKGGETPDLTSEASLARAVLQPGNKLLAVSWICKYEIGIRIRDDSKFAKLFCLITGRVLLI